jgi:hypothetical protein
VNRATNPPRGASSTVIVSRRISVSVAYANWSTSAPSEISDTSYVPAPRKRSGTSATDTIVSDVIAPTYQSVPRRRASTADCPG